MSVLKTAWANLQDGLGNRFSWSHVKAIFYNYAEHKLLSTKLDEMDALIDAKIAKAMMSSVQVNDESKVPTSALAYAMQQQITENEEAITGLNSELVRINNGLSNRLLYLNNNDEISMRARADNDGYAYYDTSGSDGTQFQLIFKFDKKRIDAAYYDGSSWDTKELVSWP